MKPNRRILIPDREPKRGFTKGEMATLLVSAVVSLGILVWAWGKGI